MEGDLRWTESRHGPSHDQVNCILRFRDCDRDKYISTEMCRNWAKKTSQACIYFNSTRFHFYIFLLCYWLIFLWPFVARWNKTAFETEVPPPPVLWKISLCLLMTLIPHSTIRTGAYRSSCFSSIFVLGLLFGRYQSRGDVNRFARYIVLLCSL